MELKEIFDALKSSELENKQTIIDSFSAIVSAKNEEAKTHRTKYESSNSMLNELKKFAGVPEEMVEADKISDYLYDKQLTGDKSSQELSKLQRQFEKIQSQLELERTEKETIKKTSLAAQRDSEISKLLASSNIRSEAVDGLQKMFTATASYEDDKWSVDGEDLKSGISKYLESNPYLLKSEQKTGTGSKPPADVHQDKQIFTYKEVQAMSADERKKNSTAIALSSRLPTWA